jgi:proprotein convertase subtilisin/kexin type 5
LKCDDQDSCSACSATDQCGECDDSLNFNSVPSGSGTCECVSGYTTNTGAPSACVECDSKCNECSGSATACVACADNNNRELSGASPNTCVCESGYYEPTPANDVCVKCHYSCLTCDGGTASDCTGSACPTGSDRTFSVDSCPCDPGFYDDGLNTACVACTSPCKECVDTGTKCTACDSGN